METDGGRGVRGKKDDTLLRLLLSVYLSVPTCVPPHVSVIPQSSLVFEFCLKLGGKGLPLGPTSLSEGVLWSP